MDYLGILLLAAIQGITEFLPVSSSAHLIVTPQLFNIEDQGIIIDVALHTGSLLAVLVYFYRDCLKCIQGFISLLLCTAMKKPYHDESKMVLNLIVATLPISIIGIIFFDLVAEMGRHIGLIIGATMLFAPLLWWADKQPVHAMQTIETLTLKQAFLVGLCQMFALIPGASRAGTCLIGLRFIGLSRQESMRFAMLLSIPAIGAASILTAWKWLSDPIYAQDGLSSQIILIIISSFIVALITISLLMRWIERIGFLPLVLYRVFFAGFLYYWFYL